MTTPGAYEDEMGRFLRFSDRDLDRLLDGRTPAADGELEDLAAFLDDVRAVFTEAPRPEVQARHLVAMSEAARNLADKSEPVARPARKVIGPARQASGLPPLRRRIMSNRFVGLTTKLVAACVGLMMVTTGLAFAGVDLPGTAAEEAFDAVLGVDLPNQSDDEIELGDDLETDVLEGDGPDDAAADVAQEIWNYINTTEDTGCTFGQNVAAIASGDDPTPDEDPCTAGEGEDGQVTGSEKAAEARATGESKAQSGKARGDEGRATGESKGRSGDDVDDDSAKGSQETGQEAAEGQSSRA